MIEAAEPVAAGRAARHCAQLLSRAAEPVDASQEVVRLAKRFAQLAEPLLAKYCDARGLRIEIREAVQMPCEEVCALVGDASVSSFFALGTDRTGILASVATCDLIAVFERLLGGEGRVDPANSRLPQSAMQFALRFQQHLLTALRAATDRAEVSVAASHGAVREVIPFAASETLWSLEFEVMPPAGPLWKLRLALCRATLAQITGARASSPATGRVIGERGLTNSAIGHVELPLRAVLVDTAVPLARLAQLQPGAIIPVALNRSVPLIIEQAVIAHGAVGEIDDRVALEVSHSLLPGKH